MSTINKNLRLRNVFTMLKESSFFDDIAFLTELCILIQADAPLKFRTSR